MARRAPNLTGQRFGKLIVVERAGNFLYGTKVKNSRWRCICDCSNECFVNGASLRRGKTKSCGCLRKELGLRSRANNGGRHYAWKGGKYTNKQGYVLCYVDVGKYRFEHVIIMERKLKRSLFPDETVHHKNGIRNDNTEDNLELRVKAKHPKGASVPDLLNWADEIIKRYRTQ